MSENKFFKSETPKTETPKSPEQESESVTISHETEFGMDGKSFRVKLEVRETSVNVDACPDCGVTQTEIAKNNRKILDMEERGEVVSPSDLIESEGRLLPLSINQYKLESLESVVDLNGMFDLEQGTLEWENVRKYLAEKINHVACNGCGWDANLEDQEKQT